MADTSICRQIKLMPLLQVITMKAGLKNNQVQFQNVFVKIALYSVDVLLMLLGVRSAGFHITSRIALLSLAKPTDLTELMDSVLPYAGFFTLILNELHVNRAALL